MSRGMWIIIILITIMMVSSYWFGRDREAPPWAKCKESLFEQVVFKNCTPSSLVRPQNQEIQLDDSTNTNNIDDQGLPLELPDSNQ
ncbi:MAG: hypothetical protein CFH30_00467 [Alphaproteobacteria bacterium MarineAlpha8_Bin1]|nr:MAG: hypothetical protein CFH30_00467 [Alphaproteobacteria bacterium MarineAlpha8_Bin1]